MLDSVPDYYSQLLTKVRRGRALTPSPSQGSQASPLCSRPAVCPQNNLSNPPTPPSSLPPTPPPSVQQKMVNGVTAPEELGEQPKDTDPAREPHGQKGECGWHEGGTESLPPPVTLP